MRETVSFFRYLLFSHIHDCSFVIFCLWIWILCGAFFFNAISFSMFMFLIFTLLFWAVFTVFSLHFCMPIPIQFLPFGDSLWWWWRLLWHYHSFLYTIQVIFGVYSFVHSHEFTCSSIHWSEFFQPAMELVCASHYKHCPGVHPFYQVSAIYLSLKYFSYLPNIFLLIFFSFISFHFIELL